MLVQNTKENYYNEKFFIIKEIDPDSLETRLPRAWNKGTSAINRDSLKDTILINRADDNGKYLSYDEFIKRFLTLKGD